MPHKPVRKSKRIQNKRKKGFSWRILTKGTKSRKSMKRAAVTALLFLVSIGFIGGIQVYRALTKPSAAASSSTAFDIKNTQIATLAVMSVNDINADPVETESISLIFFDTEKKKVVSFEIPLGLTLDVPGRFGSEPYRNILPLGSLDSGEVGEGADLVRESLEKLFGFPVDRYLLVEEDYSGPVLETFKLGRSRSLLNLDSLRGFLTASVTDASISEIYSLYTLVNSLPSDRFIVHENSEDFYADSSYVDSVIRDLTFDSRVAHERASVAVLNGAGVSGAAGFGQRVIENIGGYVVSAGNATDLYQETTLIVDSVDSEVAKEIVRFFPIKNIIEKRAFGNIEDIADRVDATLVIGIDMAESL